METRAGYGELCPAGASACATDGGEIQATSHRATTLGNGKISRDGFCNEHAAMDSSFRRGAVYACRRNESRCFVWMLRRRLAGVGIWAFAFD